MDYSWYMSQNCSELRSFPHPSLQRNNQLKKGLGELVKKQKTPPPPKKFLQSKKDWTDYKKPLFSSILKWTLGTNLFLKTFSTRSVNKFYLGSCFILDIPLCFMLIACYRTNCNSNTHWRWGYQSSWQWCATRKCTPCCTELTVGNEIPLILFSYQCQ